MMPKAWATCSFPKAQAMGSVQLKAICAGGMKYQEMALGANHVESRPPHNAPAPVSDIAVFAFVDSIASPVKKTLVTVTWSPFQTLPPDP
jgi:hypothetical protein